MLNASKFTLQELKNYYFNNEIMFFTQNAVQQLHFSQAQNQYYFTKIKSIKDFCPRGRYHAYTPEAAKKYL